MSNHPSRSNFRYFKVSPRGFRNEVVIFRVPLDKIAEVNKQFKDFEDRSNGGHCNWIDNSEMHGRPGVAVEWEDRAYVGY